MRALKYLFRFILLLLSLATLRAEAKVDSAHSGHFVVEEQPEFVTAQLVEFFK
jgi:hypothetical protein